MRDLSKHVIEARRGEGAILFPPLSRGRWRVLAPEGFNPVSVAHSPLFRGPIKPPRNCVAVPIAKGDKVGFMLFEVKNTSDSDRGVMQRSRYEYVW